MIAKWLVLIAIVAVVWYGFKIIIRRNKEQQLARHRRKKEGIEDLRPCPICDAYVGANQRHCGRGDCTFPRS